MAPSYVLGQTYVDKGTPHNNDDQFLRWFNIQGSGMLNNPGIRPFKFVSLAMPKDIPAYLILVTHEKRGFHNPWDDVVDLSSGRIRYWGDAKDHATKFRPTDFRGNQCLEVIYNLILEQKWELVPPILHFTKPKSGLVRFNGLCILNKLELTWFDDHSKPIKNFRCDLTVLDEQTVSVDWLHARALAQTVADLDHGAPKVWKQYQNGRISRLKVWMSKIKSTAEQLPAEGTDDARILHQLYSLGDAEFETAVVQLFSRLEDVVHSIYQTQLSRDGGFDFHGQFTLPEPVLYDVRFKGEVKKWSRHQAVGPKDVSRLVARLDRGEYGIFVTTSYFSRAAQEEVYSDGYPVRLFSGADLVNLMKSLRLVISGQHIDPAWLTTIRNGESRT